MADSDEDLGLGLRLPWGPAVRPPADEAFAPPSDGPPAEVQQGSEAEPEAVALPATPGAAPPSQGIHPGTKPPLDAAALQRSLETFLTLFERRCNRMEKQLASVDVSLPHRLEQVEARLAARAARDASPVDTAPVGGMVLEHLERGIDRGVNQLKARLERLETLVVASHTTTMEAVDGIGGDVSEVDAVGEVLDRRLDRLETLVLAFHETTTAAIGSLAPAARLDAVEARLQSRLDQMADQIGSSHQTTLQAMKLVAPAELVTALITGVVTTGEMLDAELIDLKRVLAGQQPSGDRA